ncbi:MAG TPA: hypothetical protein VIS71_10780, partial [Terrimicrobium sp.]
ADNAVWDTMDQAALALVQRSRGARPISNSSQSRLAERAATLATIRSQMRDGLGTDHRESGTSWMGAPG